MGDLIEFDECTGSDVRGTFGIYIGPNPNSTYYSMIYSQILCIILECILENEYEKVNI